MSRYQHLIQLIDAFRPKSIIEIGTWNGNNGIRMTRAARVWNPHCTYLGYDLFESASEQTDSEELNVKAHPRYDVVLGQMKQHLGDGIELRKGNTRQILSPSQADFVFIDGGHSIETINHDFNMLKHSGLIILDDYYAPDHEGKCPDITKFGCNKLLEEIPHYLLPTKDLVQGGGFVQLAVVIGR